jgi:hypothetical protein
MTYSPPGKPTPEEARKLVLGLFARSYRKALLIGPISMELGRYYSLNETFWLLEEMLGEGLLRRARLGETELSDQAAYVKL